MTQTAKRGRKSSNGNRSTRAKETSRRKGGQPKEISGVIEERIAKRAYEIYLKRGGQPGRELEDWLEAEHEVRIGAAS